MGDLNSEEQKFIEDLTAGAEKLAKAMRLVGDDFKALAEKFLEASEEMGEVMSKINHKEQLPYHQRINLRNFK